MLSLTTISLLICAGSTAADVPQLPPWPTGLPDAVEVTRETPLDDLIGMTCMPPTLADAVHYRLEAAEALPGRCGVRLDRLDAEWSARLDAQRVRDLARRGTTWKEWLEGGIVGGAIVVVAGGAALAWRALR